MKTMILLIALWGVGCGDALGGSEAGNPDGGVVRFLTGTVTGSEQASLAKGASDTCAADHVIATDSRALTTSADLADDCSFSLELTVGKSYSVSFTLNDQFVATLFVQNASGGAEESIVIIGRGTGSIALGTITFTSGRAASEQRPAEQCDSDDDGTDDYNDDDDDNDGSSDDEEEDCDNDGHRDDFDEDESECEEESEDDSSGEDREDSDE